ncbi:flagellum-associated coiled-coil domain-containing protein 1 isoform X1 [Sarcophilus harrisii]|uniref:Flagellum associated containing coiled-coil domains 1 n=1 Tax=Sarcophilus harrisii TaxID=9305 RepID=A0A7N4PL58_SARHA|nr:flagellum-associated coiled-coil domain-containing protein 1 isoform X1 [Sarcophilus harrisii]XP_031814199.1 flagellum-associated coiled-coil domain-containing protein 1 isoform X1 [Sarcophilus harrisii]XP_031814200.1 flagellum-associated coiled-coil domain-containing protein 1 isoform X1 [Sarcophilus harrisii]XP_031814201.1 flagellum-associated coiled-coil domain-containing protein 1 isoform X1 [Sarcophilus harrisii]XP_031814202.1 flagellum-associated coiled-coil domain-containing protein 1
MSDSSLIYCSCWDTRNLGPKKLLRASLLSPSGRQPKLSPISSALKERNYFLPPQIKPLNGPRKQVQSKEHASQKEKKTHEDTKKISPGFTYSRSDEEISVILGDELFERPKKPKEDRMLRLLLPRTDVILDLENQIAELTTVIEQISRDHQTSQKLLTEEMENRYNDLQKEFENSKRELKETHLVAMTALEERYKAALKMEKSSAQGKLESMVKEYKYLKNMFRMYQDSISDEMEEKWSRRKIEWEKSEKMEREKILLQQKYRLTKKFEVDVEEEKRKIEELHIQECEKFSKEREAFIKQHEVDVLNLEQLQKSKEIIEEELQAQSLVLESLNTSLYQSQVELQKEKNHAINLEQILQQKLVEVEEKYKYMLQNLTDENLELRNLLILRNEELFQERSKREIRQDSFVYQDILTDSENLDPEQES